MEPTAKLCTMTKQRFQFIVLFNIPLYYSDGTQLFYQMFLIFLAYLSIMTPAVSSIDIQVDHLYYVDRNGVALKRSLVKQIL